MTRGVVVGKFYPPHAGHMHLINVAAAQVDRLDVLVCWREDQSIPGQLRSSWLRELCAQHPNVHIHEVWDFGDDDNSEAWARYTIEHLGFKPEVAFTSEEYGDAFARCLGARHVAVDPSRTAVPIRGTQVRGDPLRYWEYLSPPVRAWYALRVAIVGAESTGTTTLARSLAELYATEWVPEYGRDYCATLVASGARLEEHQWSSDEFLLIAQTQLEREDRLARVCNKVLFCDTDVLATSIWHERYLGAVSESVRAIADARSYALHILTDCDIGFVQDGLRDGEHMREWMTRRFRDELVRTKRRWILVRGTHEERIQSASSAIDALLSGS